MRSDMSLRTPFSGVSENASRFRGGLLPKPIRGGRSEVGHAGAAAERRAEGGRGGSGEDGRLRGGGERRPAGDRRGHVALDHATAGTAAREAGRVYALGRGQLARAGRDGGSAGRDGRLGRRSGNRRCNSRGGRAWRRRNGAAQGRLPVLALLSDDGDGLEDGNVVSLRAEYLEQKARGSGRDIEAGLVGLDLAERLVRLDRLALRGFPPDYDAGFDRVPLPGHDQQDEPRRTSMESHTFVQRIEAAPRSREAPPRDHRP